MPSSHPTRPCLSFRHLALLRAIFDHLRRTREFPRNTQIAAALGVSGHHVAATLALLTKKGMLYRPRYGGVFGMPAGRKLPPRGALALTKAGMWAARPRRGPRTGTSATPGTSVGEEVLL